MSNTHSHLAYGIDFGTSNSTVSVERGGRIQTLDIEPTSKSASILRSLLYFDPNHNNILFGNTAINAYLKDIAEGKSTEKKYIDTGKKVEVVKPATLTGGWDGTEWIPEIIQVEVGDAGRLIQSLKSGLGSSYVKTFQVFDKTYDIEEISSMLLSEIKRRADEVIGHKVDFAVIGKPVHFVGGNDKLAVERLTKAARIAGFKKVIFEFEPVGAAWKYVSDNQNVKELCFVFDFGGGTLDFSIVELPIKKVIINDGLPIGGDLINTKIFEDKLLKYFGGNALFGKDKAPLPSHIKHSLRHWYLISLLKTREFLGSIEKLKAICDTPQTMDALFSLIDKNLGFLVYEEIDRVKKSLSEKLNDNLNISQKDIFIDENLTRFGFEKILSENLATIENKIDEILTKTKLKPEQINTVITTGGSSLIPIIQELIARKFPASKIHNQDPFTSVSQGLALRAREIFK